MRQPTYDAEEDLSKHCDSELHRDVDDTASTLKPEESEPVEQEEPERKVSSRRTATPQPPSLTTVLPPPTQQGPYLRQMAVIRTAVLE
ncbi:hypothetical protein Tco_0547067, partial [Tanacetum coccineum]